ncbi:glycine oxidase ThiO [Phytohabitans kaempferiae]|uniref:glycine oxidase n=1 Tax=Phytohabitans kaempferiae TaxID=1620943 RepID=A0ABV6LVK7_9ACTN
MNDVTVVGAGPIGLAIAWRCAARGMTVEVADDGLPGAWHAAAGMLGPVSESYFGEGALTALLVESARRWPGFAAELGAEEIGYRASGTLVVALTGDDLAEVERLRVYQESLGLPITPQRPGELRDREPLLSPRVRGGAYAPDDHQVDPRRLVPALRGAATSAGAAIVREPRPARITVVAAGTGSAAVAGVPVRPVKGQILRLRAPGHQPPGFSHVIRGYADGRHAYLVPRLDGEVVVGATVEERTDAHVTAGGVSELLRAAADLVPEINEYELVEAIAGHRPGTPDNAPLIGAVGEGVIVATGHYRHGIVLTPVTADLVADLVETGVPDPMLGPFAPGRFA